MSLITKNQIFTLIVFIVLLGAWLGLMWYQNNHLKNNQWMGQISKITEDHLEVYAVNLNSSDPSKSDFKNRQNVTIYFDSKTQFVKIIAKQNNSAENITLTSIEPASVVYPFSGEISLPKGSRP